MGNINTKEKYIISYTTNFKKQYKKIIKQGKAEEVFESPEFKERFGDF